MYRILLPFCIAIIFSLSITAQSKKMDETVYDIWNTINEVKISNNGDWVCYVVKPGKGNNTLHLYNTKTTKKFSFERSDSAEFDPSNNFIVFKIHPDQDSLRNLKIKKTKIDDLPKDSLGIFLLESESLDKIPLVDSYKIPKEDGGIMAYKMHKRNAKKDTTLVKKEGDNGTALFVKDFRTGRLRNYPYVKDYKWSEKNNQLLIHSSGIDSIQNNVIFVLDGESGVESKIHQEKGEYEQMVINKEGDRVAFIADRDTSKVHQRPYELFYWSKSNGDVEILANQESQFLSENQQISKYYRPLFTEDGQRLFFGISAIPFEEDTTILDEEKVELEVWNYKDGLLFTQQESQLSREKKRSYEVSYDLNDHSFVVLADSLIPETDLSNKTKGRYVLSYTDLPYQKYISWLGYAFKDLYLTDLTTGEKTLIANKIQGSPRMSPAGNYIYWYSRPDSSWMSYQIESSRIKKITTNGFYDELNDRPMHPRNSGMLGWTVNDENLLIYDQYDIWKIDPSGKSDAINLTRGRKNKLRYRHIRIDREVEYYPADTTILLKVFDEKDKSSGYVYLNLATHFMRPVAKGPFSYSTRIIKAKNSDELIYTRESFNEFPDLILSDTKFSYSKKISDANPQQKEYAWGSIELITWIDTKGEKVEGLLVKPPNFDPTKKYPMIVNFYERSSHGLHRHREPYPHRSTINYTYYSNRGYVIFNPDIKYEIGYPGKSCYEAVMSGVDAVIKMGYVDESRMALQGHSWGGYQIAHILTKTDRFKCAEAGAPVVNMVSAYGGIRWGSGMSRMFQYERTQSRLGATLWERPDLYLENSPIFNIDKVETPVLILHNDKDGAVPWYQGIEYFVALRRLGKPAWLLNYNDEPHWPVKRNNRLDFNKRLSQFFDYYLMDAPIPDWIDIGIPAVEKGYNDGFKLKN